MVYTYFVINNSVSECLECLEFGVLKVNENTPTLYNYLFSQTNLITPGTLDIQGTLDTLDTLGTLGTQGIQCTFPVQHLHYYS